MIQVFVGDDEVAVLEQEFLTASGTRRLQLLVALAWHLRQRDTRRAESLAERAQTMLASSALPLLPRQRMAARILIILAEVKWLFADMGGASFLIDQALHETQQLADLEGLADAWWARGVISNYQGDSQTSGSAFRAALDAAQLAQDPMRVRLILSALGMTLAYRDQQAAVTEYGALTDLSIPGLAPGNRATFHDFWASVATQRSEFGLAIEHWNQCFQYANQVGQIFRTIMSFANICDSFNNLNDHHSALEWMQRGLDLARSTAWPIAIGACLMQMGETLRRLGRLETAQTILDEALATLEVIPASRTYAAALGYLGDLELDRHDWSAAYRTFCHLHKRADALNQPEFQIQAMRGQAHALLQLRSIDSALVAAHAARSLALKKQDPYLLIDVLKVLADIHAQHVLPDVPGMTAMNVQLHYLQQAQQIANSISGYTLPGDVLDALAQAHAAANDYDAALSASRAAREAHDKTHSQEANNRVIALQVRHQTERAQASKEYHRQLALAEAERVQALQLNSEILLHLGAIGQEIAAHLEAEGLFQALNRHVHRLLDAHLFRIYLVDAQGQSLTSVLNVENEQVADSHHVLNTSNLANAARCVRERREIMINGDVDSDGESTENSAIEGIVEGTIEGTIEGSIEGAIEGTSQGPGTSAGAVMAQGSGNVAAPVAIPVLSRLFAPLMTGERVLGVMTIQSLREHAYGEREQLIFRTLCAYGAIALDNANAYHQLQQAQSQLVAQEKLAALGALVAGVAHELNAPIGTGLQMSRELERKVDVLNLEIEERRLRLSCLNQFVADTRELTHQILKTLTHAAELVSSFKQVAVDRTSAKRRMFHLQQTCQEIISTLQSQLRLSGHAIELDMPDDIIMDSYPGPLGQVLTNIINNALLHAFDGHESGHMSLRARQVLPERVMIVFADSGKGIPQQNLCRIFDPFFTTKTGQGDNGLGMNIVYNIVTSLLNGKIDVESEPGAGTTVVLDLPLTVAQAPETSTV